MKALVVRPPKRNDVDVGDILAIARAEGKRLFKTRENIQVIDLINRPYGWVVVIQFGCSQDAGCKRGMSECCEKDSEHTIAHASVSFPSDLQSN